MFIVLVTVFSVSGRTKEISPLKAFGFVIQQLFERRVIYFQLEA
jgi:hypothetical protein